MAIKRDYRNGVVQIPFNDWADIIDHLHCAETLEQKEYAKSLGDTIGEPVTFDTCPNELEPE